MLKLLKNTLKCSGFIFLIFVGLAVNAQNTPQKIDSLYSFEVLRLRDAGKYNEIIALCESLIKDSKKIAYQDGVVKGHALIGDYAIALGNFDLSLKNLIIAQNLSQNTKNSLIKAQIAIALGKCYNEQKLSPDVAILEFKKGAKHAGEIAERKQRDSYLIYAYENLISAFYNKSAMDSSLHYIHKSLKIRKTVYAITAITHYYLNYKHNSDSAYHYLKIADEMEMPYYNKVYHYLKWGEYCTWQKDYEKAKLYYKKSLKLAEESKQQEGITQALENLIQIYKLSNDQEGADEYHKKYSTLKDSLRVHSLKSANDAVNNIVRTEQKEFNDNLEKTNRRSAYIVVGFLFASAALILYVFKRIKDKKRQISAIRGEFTLQKEELKTENEGLKQKVNESFVEVVELAKENSPQFWTRFQEVYPSFLSKMLSLNAKLTTAELSMAAYLYLGFSSKEITSYTSRSSKTVETIRYNLRKKIGLPSDENLTIWLQNYIGG